MRFNHGMAVLVADNGRIADNFIHHNGQQGIGAHGNNVTIHHNELSFNNTTGFDEYWSAGGAKIASANGVTFRANYVHDNYGYGLWTTSTATTWCSTATGSRPTRRGASTADLPAATITNNRVIGNKAQGIYLNSSPNVTVARTTGSRRTPTGSGSCRRTGEAVPTALVDSQRRRALQCRQELRADRNPAARRRQLVLHEPQQPVPRQQVHRAGRIPVDRLQDRSTRRPGSPTGKTSTAPGRRPRDGDASSPARRLGGGWAVRSPREARAKGGHPSSRGHERGLEPRADSP